MADIQSQLPVAVTDGTNTAAITNGGAIKIDGSAVTQPVSGSVSVSNFPATQPVSGSVSVSNLPATQPVSGTVSVSNFPATQPVSGTVTASVSNFPATQTVSGTVTANAGTGTFNMAFAEKSTGVVASANSATAVVIGGTGVITYTVSSSKTLFLKQIIASASGGPCTVKVDTGTGSPVTVFIGFFSAASPTLDIRFAQPIPVTTAVNIRITNNASLAQNVYGSVFGLEV